MNKHTQSLYDYVVFLMPEMIKQPGKSLIDPRVAKKHQRYLLTHN